MLKVCFKCSLELPRSEFYAHPQMGDGLLGKCKACTRKDAIQNRNEKIGAARAYDRKRNKLPHRIALHRLKTDRLRNEDDGIRARAWNAVRRALRTGKLIRPASCSACPLTAHVAAHHDDYTKPLEVTWLCPICHAARHKELGRLRTMATMYGDAPRLGF